MARSSAKHVRQTGTTRGPKPLDAHVGSRVRARRLILGMSQTALGDALGITFQQVQKYEKGTNRIGASRLQQIADVLEVPISFFFETWSQEERDTRRGDTGLTEITKALATNLGIELMKAFVRIDDQDIRRDLVRLATAIADSRTLKA